ncbi:hypothetical protein B0H14DRAFT_2899262 [Mycena olivaceomarginata]|nr:hypothetical protein B0H14DRAFT_2899262 [Mycena olivaceomarginata]
MYFAHVHQIVVYYGPSNLRSGILNLLLSLASAATPLCSCLTPPRLHLILSAMESSLGDFDAVLVLLRPRSLRAP